MSCLTMELTVYVEVFFLLLISRHMPKHTNCQDSTMNGSNYNVSQKNKDTLLVSITSQNI